MTAAAPLLPPRRGARRICCSVALAAAVLLGGCAGVAIRPGDTTADVLQRRGAPSAEHALPDGARRLEYNGGAYGTTTLMVDTDAHGRVLRAENVRVEAHFNRIQAGITRDVLRRDLGAPSMVWGIRYRNQTVWSYRFEGPFCLIFHVGISPQGVVEDTSYGPDPICEDRDLFSRSRWR
jgi:hypothetical protein